MINLVEFYESLKQTIAKLEAKIEKLEVRIAELETENENLRDKNKALRIKNAELKERLVLNSQNSSITSSKYRNYIQTQKHAIIDIAISNNFIRPLSKLILPTPNFRYTVPKYNGKL